MSFYDSLGSSEAVGFGLALTTAPGEAATARFRLGPDARVLNADGRDVVPGSGEAGMLAVAESTAIGYYKDPERTAATFREIDGRPYAVPGDWAMPHDDGTITLLGRGSGCINTGGEKVWPEEVEEVLKQHPDVVDAVVVGVPDDEWGEIVAAVVARAATNPRTPPRSASGSARASPATSGRGGSSSSTRCSGRRSARPTTCGPAVRSPRPDTHHTRCSSTSAAARVSSWTKKCVPATSTRSPPARLRLAGNMPPGGRSRRSHDGDVAVERRKVLERAARASGRVPHSKNRASTSGGHASSTCPSGRSWKPQRT